MSLENRGRRVYFAQCDFGGPIKIGHSVNRSGRVATLSLDIPFNLVEIGSIPGGPFRERFIHSWFRPRKIRREWFEPTAELWRWALQARTKGEIQEIPAEPDSIGRLSLAPVKKWISGEEARLQTIAAYAGVLPKTLEGYLDSEIVSHMSIIAAYAVMMVRCGEWIDWSIWPRLSGALSRASGRNIVRLRSVQGSAA